LYRKVEEELVRVGRELKEEKENGEKETRSRKQMETALKVEQTNILNIWWPIPRFVMFHFTDW
jgi:hypothetical protein